MRVFVAHLDDLLDWTPRSTRNPVSQTRTPSFLLKRTKRGGKNLHVLWAAKIKSIASKSLREHQQIQDLSGWNMIEIYIYIYMYIYICIYIYMYIYMMIAALSVVCSKLSKLWLSLSFLLGRWSTSQAMLDDVPFLFRKFFFAENIYIYAYVTLR